MNRRGFLSSCIALAAAPAIVRADSLMRIIPMEQTVMFFPNDMELGAWNGGNASIQEIIAQTIASRSAMLAANIERNNHLLRYARAAR